MRPLQVISGSWFQNNKCPRNLQFTKLMQWMSVTQIYEWYVLLHENIWEVAWWAHISSWMLWKRYCLLIDSELIAVTHHVFPYGLHTKDSLSCIIFSKKYILCSEIQDNWLWEINQSYCKKVIDNACSFVMSWFWSPLWWRISLSIRVQTTLNHFWFVKFSTKHLTS